MAHLLERDDEMVQCPYNSAHTMLRKRLQPHLAKCRLSYPDVELLKCPFNAAHMVPEPEFRHHCSTCIDKVSVTNFKYKVETKKVEPKITPQEKVECDDDWDDDDAGTYNPQDYASKAQVVRNANSAVPSERKAFREAERRRHGDYDEFSDEDF